MSGRQSNIPSVPGVHPADKTPFWRSVPRILKLFHPLPSIIMKLLFLCSLFALARCAILGIDLGHENMEAIMVAPGISFGVIYTDEGKRKDASVIYLKPIMEDVALVDTERAFGSQVGSLCTRYPSACASNLKALLGKDVNDDAVRHYIEHHPAAEIVANSQRNDSVLLRLGTDSASHSFPVEELMAMSLNNLKQRALKVLELHTQARSVAEDVAVSIPSYADQVTRLAYLDVLLLGEFSTVLGLVDEGAAAAIAYVFGRKFAPEEYDGRKSYHVIYDVGAGSTTATFFSYVAHKNKTVVVDIESFGYDASFGGEFLTRNVYDILYAKFLAQFGLDESVKLSPRSTARLIEASEEAKKILSANSDHRVALESFYNDKDFRAMITRQEFEDYSSDSAERAIQPILDALDVASTEVFNVSNISSVILNGGSTRTPFIQKQVIALLGSEEKISKVVNADEACALGTAVRAYQLKMMSDSSDIILHDRIFSNFEVSINSSDALELVFAKGSAAGNITEIDFGKFSNEFEISLYENSKHFLSYVVSDLAKRAEDLKCPSEAIIVTGVFQVDQNKIFSFHELILKCPKKETPLSTNSKTTKETASKEEELDGTTLKESTHLNFTKGKLRTLFKIPISSAHFSKLRPLNVTEKKDIFVELRNLRAKDEERIVLQEKKNELESLCYNLRSFLEEKADLAIEIGEEEFEKFGALVPELLEWLEYDSEGATFDEIEFKKATVAGAKEKLNRTLRMVESDLTLPELKKILSEGKGIKTLVEKYLKEHKSQLANLKAKYEDAGFDFEAEDKKIYGLKKKGDDALSEHFKVLKNSLDSLQRVVKLPVKKFEALTKEELFEASEGVASLIYNMMDDVFSLQKKHEERIEFLIARLEKLEQRQAQKEFRLKKKAAAEKEAAEKAANKTINVEEDAAPDSMDGQQFDADPAEELEDAAPEYMPEPTDVDHDEL